MKMLPQWLISIFVLVLQTPLLAQDADAPPVREQNLWQMFIMIAIFVSFFYFILFRPEQKRRKAADERRNSLKKGDRVTAMGILGTVVSITDQTAVLKMVDGSKIEVLKGAINEIIPNAEGEIKPAKIEPSEKS